jgi:GNAT superfamily N-acetyltransferase
MFDGPASPITQTFGLGMFEPPTAADFATMEEFFATRGAPTYHEVTPLADPAALSLLNARGYEPFEFTSVMYRPVYRDAVPIAPRTAGLRVRLVGPEEAELCARTSAAGWAEYPGDPNELLDLMRLSMGRDGSLAFLAEIDGEAVATGVLFTCEGVALFAGASTIPAARNRGAQSALLDARLRAAADAGCDLAMMCAAPGTASQRNAERNGFRIAYTRVKWRRPEA